MDPLRKLSERVFFFPSDYLASLTRIAIATLIEENLFQLSQVFRGSHRERQFFCQRQLKLVRGPAQRREEMSQPNS